LWQILKAVVSTDHPLLAHLIPIRRCNLACTYCNEFDDFSKPVPTDEMLRRVDRLKDLGTSVITISGGEPMLHPQLDDIIHHMRQAPDRFGADHERLSADCGPHPAAEPRGPGVAADFD
jgi:MoaA/NifB/PqqE/SkfB family radical SAM enzyme